MVWRNNYNPYIPSTKKYLTIDDSYNRLNNYKEERQDSEEPIKKDFIAFTDRAIYRPGQKVFYKAILAQEYFEKTKVLPKQKVSVILQDSNGKEVAKQDAITNEFGSISGEFILPSGGLTGQFYISQTT